VAHSIEIWWEVAVLARDHAPVLMPAAETELPEAEEGDDAFVELSRQFPALSREVAAYLAR
jgi:hypothetical protein